MRSGHSLSLLGWTAVLAASCSTAPAGAIPSAEEIVKRSVTNNERNWAAAPQYIRNERDTILNGGKQTIRCYQDLMIDGWPYKELLEKDGQPLSPAEARAEAQQLEQETVHRQHESPAQRQRRIRQYLRQRQQDHELMQQMTSAFDFKLLGQETVRGRRCYVLEGLPRPDYRPINRDTQVLKAMRGKLWVDADTYQWVKVHAEVFRPVSFGLFIARVQPGTQFTLEEAPVAGDIWQPARFDMDQKATIVFFWSRHRSEHNVYTDYHRPTRSPIAHDQSSILNSKNIAPVPTCDQISKRLKILPG